jgi:hypothetical protein
MPPAKWSVPSEVGEVAGAYHAFQPLFDVARLHPRFAHHLVQAQRPLALHRAEKPCPGADIDHAGRHRAGHVAEYLLGYAFGFFAVHWRLGYR